MDRLTQAEKEAQVALNLERTKLFQANQEIVRLKGIIQDLRLTLDEQSKAFAKSTELHHVALSQLRAQVLNQVVSS